VGFLAKFRGKCPKTYKTLLQNYGSSGQESRDVYGPYDNSEVSSNLELTVNGVKMPEVNLPSGVGGATEVVSRKEGGHKPGMSYVSKLWAGAKQKYAGFHEWRHRKDLIDYPYLIEGAKILYGKASRQIIEAITEIQTRRDNPKLLEEAGVGAYEGPVNTLKNLIGKDLMKRVEEIKAECNEAGKRAYESGKEGYNSLKGKLPSVSYSSIYPQAECDKPCRYSRKYCC